MAGPSPRQGSLLGEKVILLDEVSMGLAPRVVDEVFEALHALARTTVEIMLVEQYVTRATAMAHQVVLLSKGVSTYSGPSLGLDQTAVVQGYLGTGIVGQLHPLHGN
jgi:branched-chain amino acid transport system ATP-binding protein